MEVVVFQKVMCRDVPVEKLIIAELKAVRA